MKPALRIFKGTSLLFLIGYTILILVDDYVLYKNISSLSELGTFISAQFLFFVMYFVEFAVCYWVVAALVIIALKVLRRTEQKKL
jgi:hypothetical protein